MSSHIKQTGEIIDGTIRYLRFQETKGDDSKDTTYCDQLAERGQEVKDAARLLMLQYGQTGQMDEAESLGELLSRPSKVVKGLWLDMRYILYSAQTYGFSRAASLHTAAVPRYSRRCHIL